MKLRCKNKEKYILALVLIGSSWSIFAQDPSIGLASQSITSALDSITDLILAAVSIAGIACFFSAIMKLYLHRKNPQQVPISQFFSMLVMSLALIILPLLILYGDSAYNILKDL